MTIKITDEEFLALEATYMQLTSSFLDKGISPYAAAAVMTKLGMMIYKTTLNAEDYNLMIDSISDRRDMIKSFDQYGLQRLN